MSTSLVTKILRAVADLPQSFRRTPNPRIVMTLLVKNEEDMIERHLQYHKQMGVDAFIVTDNNSTDHTPEILARYVKKGWIVEVIEEKSSGYEQKKWVDRMAWLAKTKYHADWIINADADEFWYAPSGNLKNELGQTDHNVLRCCLYNMLPDDARPYWQWDKRVLPIPQPNDYNLSPYSIYGRYTYKVAHRAAGYLQISMGNHKVAMFPKKQANATIYIYHFTIRGREQFLQKMINGGRELETHKGRHGGRHWRYFYELYKQGKLEEEYDRVVGNNVYDRLVTEGYICQDTTLADIFSKM